jgi:hypothetical protein
MGVVTEKTTGEEYWSGVAFDDGVFAERTRLIAYLVEKGIIRRDAFGVWVRETMGDDVTDLPDLDGSKPRINGAKISVHPSEIGAVITRANALRDDQLRNRLFELREIAPAGSEISLALTKWVNELV